MSSFAFWNKYDLLEAAGWAETALRARPVDHDTSQVSSGLENLVRYYNLYLPSQDQDIERHRAFQQRITTELSRPADRIVSFVLRSEAIAISARDDEQFEVSWRRSAIQVLRDEHPVVLTGLAPHDAEAIALFTDNIDDELRRMGASYGRLPDDELPRGLPRTHWWWWPDPIPGYKRWEP